MKIVNLIVVVVLLSAGFGCADQKDRVNSKNIQLARKLSGNNEFYFKGRYGIVASSGLYIIRDDVSNVIYSAEGKVFKGGNSLEVEAVGIDEKNGIVFKINNVISKDYKNGIVIIFTPSAVYVMNFDESRYGWYVRQPTRPSRGIPK